MAAIPVHLVRNPEAGLLGALALALETAERPPPPPFPHGPSVD